MLGVGTTGFRGSVGMCWLLLQETGDRDNTIVNPGKELVFMGNFMTVMPFTACDS